MPFGIKLLSMFIVACGVTSLFNAAMFFHPHYRIDTVVKFHTALVLVFTGLYLLFKMPGLIAMKSPQEMEAKLKHLEKVEKELRYANRDLRHHLLYCGLLEKELQIMRGIQSDRNQAEVQKVVAKLDEIVNELTDMLPGLYADFNQPARAPV